MRRRAMEWDGAVRLPDATRAEFDDGRWESGKGFLAVHIFKFEKLH